MFVIYGSKKAKIKDYTDNQQSCMYCNANSLNVKAYKEYFHVFFIPIIPVGNQSFEIRCKKCGELNRNTPTIEYYRNLIKPPFYLYLGIILIATLSAFLLFENINTQKRKKQFVSNPKLGDVYEIRKDQNDTTSYYFLKISKISDDTIQLYHNNLEYYSYVSEFDESDFFVKNDEFIMTKNIIKVMLEKGELNNVFRNYDENDKFNKIK